MASSISSGALTANTQVVTGKGLLNGVLVNTDGTNAATVVVYDGTDTNGIMLVKAVVAGSENIKDILFNKAVRADVGLYVTVNGTGASAIVYHGTT
jgi:hypothetical protein